jgi:nitroreductase
VTDPTPPDLDLDGLAATEAVIRRRRTSLLMDPDRPVHDEIVDRLVDLVTWAPNHKRTWPWHVAWVTGDARARLGEVAAEAMAARGDEPFKIDKTRRKYLRAPGMVVVGSDAGDSDLRRIENRDATAAGVQNLLLGATAAGLASFWSSCPKGAEEPVAAWCGFPDGTAIVALVYLGWPTGTVEVPARPSSGLRRIR